MELYTLLDPNHSIARRSIIRTWTCISLKLSLHQELSLSAATGILLPCADSAPHWSSKLIASKSAADINLDVPLRHS